MNGTRRAGAGTPATTFSPRPCQKICLSWRLTPAQLEAGLSYSVDVDPGASLSFSGDVDGQAIFGMDTATLPVPADDLGPFTANGLDKGHNIGPLCTGTDIVETGTELTITGAGTDIWNNADQFMYAYGAVSGDFRAQVRIDTPKEWDYFQHGGILQYVLRQLLNPSA